VRARNAEKKFAKKGRLVGMMSYACKFVTTAASSIECERCRVEPDSGEAMIQSTR
jgi:hypothetical protein